jgi:TonB family protein
MLMVSKTMATSPASLDKSTALIEGSDLLEDSIEGVQSMIWTRTVRPLLAAFLLLAAGALAVAQTTIGTLLNEGNRGLAEKHYQDAVTAFQSAVEIEPTNTYALIGLAQAKYQAGRPSDNVFTPSANFDDAKQLLEQVLGADPDNFEANMALAKMISEQFLPAFVQARNQAGIKPDQHEPLPYGDARSNLYEQFAPSVNEGIERGERAAMLHPDSYQALHAVSGLFLMRSAVDLTPEQSDADLQKSKEWQAKSEAATPKMRVMGRGGVLSAAPPPAPGNAVPAPAGAVRIGGKVAEANLVHKVEPTYPPLAKAAQVQGTVEFTVTIGKDGKIENLQLVRGHPLLVNAAKEAVLQWQYRPTLLNGNPVTIVTSVQVDFHFEVQQ